MTINFTEMPSLFQCGIGKLLIAASDEILYPRAVRADDVMMVRISYLK
jgi:hypothetical protein